ncbi:MAG TPA: alpha-amylase family glycosyl hydrolase [Gaiellaceae bacterium]|jgi:alpha-glucosidase|nr:alpha-amylase family glycosyl hydrolase [Gaiellaceae bacterium]
MREDSDWARSAVFYQIYPRSFQDANGDGLGDLDGIRARLDHVWDLGADAIWLSPIYSSPGADAGYDITDHTAIDPAFGTLESFDQLVREAHERNLRVLLDLVPSHTSIEHPWFREHPEWYVWADDGPPNNWLSAFGGPAWSRDPVSGRWYLHSFYREQPDLNWRHPDVPKAIGEVAQFWRERGVDGFRVDAVDRLAKDPELRDDLPATGPWLLPLPPEYATLRHVHSRNAEDMGAILDLLRQATGDSVLVGEVFRPTDELESYLDHFDLVFVFEFMFARWHPEDIARVIEPAARLRGCAWVLSNHDFSRLASRLGEENLRLAAALLLTLPGAAFVYQGDEIGLRDGPGAHPPFDRAGRDGARHPMQWDDTSTGGFTSGTPWLHPVDPETRNVAEQARDPDSLLSLYRRLTRLRKAMSGGLEGVRVDGSALSYRRGGHLVTLNFGDEDLPLPSDAEPIFCTASDANPAQRVPAHGAVVQVVERSASFVAPDTRVGREDNRDEEAS